MEDDLLFVRVFSFGDLFRLGVHIDARKKISEEDGGNVVRFFPGQDLGLLSK